MTGPWWVLGATATYAAPPGATRADLADDVVADTASLSIAVDADCAPHPDNTLRSVCTVHSAPPSDATVQVDIPDAGTATFVGADGAPIVVWGLVPDEVHTWRAFPTGHPQGALHGTLTPAAPPLDIAVFTRGPALPATDGVLTQFGCDDRERLVVVDGLGRLRWYADPRAHEPDVPFLVTIPETVDETRPTVLYGHGFFSHMDEPTWSQLQGLIQPGRLIMVSTNFIGFNSDEQAEAFTVLADLNRTAEISAMQMQSVAHFVVLGRLVREQLAPVLTEDRGAGPFSLMDPDRLIYMGISNGGTQGLTIMSVAPNLDRGVLVVPGGGLIHFLQRASQWLTMGPLLSLKFDNELDFQLGTSLMQHHLDPWDSINFVDHLISPRFDGRPPVRLSVHEAVEDAQVNNMVTHWIARTAGLPMFSPNTLEPWGLDTLAPQEATGPAALYIYDEGYPPLPRTNTPPEENGAHNSVRELEVYKEHVTTFIVDDRLPYACDGACDPE